MAALASGRGSTLASLLEELGYAATATETTAVKIVQYACDSSDPGGVAAALGVIVCASEGHALSDRAEGLASAIGGLSLSDVAQAWNANALVNAVRSAAPALDWNAVATALDQPGFLVRDQEAFQLLVSAFRCGGLGGLPLPAVLNRVWTNIEGQLSILQQAVAAPSELFSFKTSPRKQAPIDGLTNNASRNGTANEAWMSLDLFETLARLAEADHAAVRSMLEAGASAAPEVLLVGFVQVRANWGPLQREIGDALASNYVAGHENSSVVLGRLWALDPDTLMRGMCMLYERDAAAISRILDVAQEVGALAIVLERTPYPLAIELAAIAARHAPQMQPPWALQPWLQDRLANCGVPFLQAALHFLSDKLANGAVLPGSEGPLQTNGKVTVTLEVIATLLRVLHEKVAVMPDGAAAALRQVHSQAMSAFPSLAGLLVPAGEGSGAASAGGPAADPKDLEDIEKLANDYFQKLYTGELSVAEVVATLSSFSKGSNREKQVFHCMVHNLFDEYQFFTKYPDKELHTTAVLFGSLVRERLVTDGPLATALRCVAEAARSPPGSKLSKFALDALTQFRDELSAWPDFCTTLLQTDHLKQADPGLAATVEKAQSGRGAGEAGEGGLLPEGLIAAEAENPPAMNAANVQNATGEGDNSGAAAALAAAGAPVSQARAVAAFELGMNAAAAPFNTSSAASRGGDASAFPRGALGLPEVRLSSGGSTSSLGLPSSAAPSARGLTFATINAETLETAARDADFPVPAEEVIDQVHFLINNLSTANLDSKSETLKDVLPREFWPWFSNYMVVKRAAQEPNFHTLYLALLDKLSGNKLGASLIATTHKYIRILLASGRIKTHTSERSLLKNLGTWLGALTLARNQALRHKDLDVKTAIGDAYEQGKMIAVLPFVGKILDATKDSKSYRPSNPWIMGIMALLAEIYAMDRLKLNLKFEIEMVFRSLGLQISDVKSSDLLAKRMRLVGADNPDFAVDKAALPPVPPRPEVAATATAPLPQPPPSEPPGAAPIPQESVVLPGPGGMDQGIFANLAAFVTISPSLGLLSERLQLKRVVPVAVDRAICEIITPVVERSVTIACMTTRELVVKDFAMEPDEAAVRQAAHAMVTCLAGSLALVTCKEPLRGALTQHLRQLLQVPGLEQSTLDNAVNTVTADNLDLGCRMIEKAAHDKAVRDIDDRLAQSYTARQNAKASGQTFYDVSVVQALVGTMGSSLPESLRPRVSALSPHQSRLYADYGRIRTREESGSEAGSETGDNEQSLGPSAGEGSAAQAAASQLQEKYVAWQQRLDNIVASDPQAEFRELPQGAPLRQTAVEVVQVLGDGPSREDAGLAVARKVFMRVLETAGSKAASGAYAASLAAIAGSTTPRLPAELTAVYVRMEDDRKYQRTVGEYLVRERLLLLPEVDAHFAAAITANQAGGATELAVHLLKAAAQDPQPPLTGLDLSATSEVLAKLAQHTSGGAPLLALLEAARAVAPPAPTDQPQPPQRMDVPRSAPTPVSDPNEPAGLREQVAVLFDRWAAISEEQPSEKVHAPFVSHLQQSGFLKGDEGTDRFLRVLLELAVAHCLASEQPLQPLSPPPAGQAALPDGAPPPFGTFASAGRVAALSFLAIDAAVRLLVLLISGHNGSAALLSRTLSVMTQVLQRDAEERGEAFNSRPYFRLCIGLICELSPPASPRSAPVADQENDSNFAMLSAFASAFRELQPLYVPGFAFAWLELISHRSFMPAMLNQAGNQGWPAFEGLLRGMLRFLEPYLRNAQLTVSVRNLYKGTLRVLLVLLHDFPELLCEYHFGLCDCVPPSCIQMRNLLLSAFPRAMRLPDPFTLGLKVDLLPEIQLPPRFSPSSDVLLESTPALKMEVDGYLSNRAPSSWVAALPSRLLLAPRDVAGAGTRYNTPLMNALVFYVGIQAIASQGGPAGAAPPVSSPAMDIFGRLVTELDTEGRYLFLNSLANQLRYPNSHTHWFSCILLSLFAEAKQEIILEQITRVLLERLIVNRPHPWGLLITFIELIKNPRYNFWTHAFTHCAPEIDRLFESVARSCMQSHEPTPAAVQAAS